MFQILNGTFSEFHNPFKNLATDGIIISFKGRVIFKQCIPKNKKSKRFSIITFRLCDSIGHTYDMKVYLGKDRQRTAQHVTANHVTVTELTKKTEARGHKLLDNFISPPELFGDLAKKQIYCYKTIKLKWGDICTGTRADVMVLLWWDERDICVLMNIHDAPAESNFCSERGKAIKPQNCDGL